MCLGYSYVALSYVSSFNTVLSISLSVLLLVEFRCSILLVSSIPVVVPSVLLCTRIISSFLGVLL